VARVVTILKVEVLGLRDIVTTMSPSQVMDALGVIFDTFAGVIAKFPTVHGIRWNEEGMVAVAGLLDSSTDLKQQSEESALAAIEFRDMKDDLNDRIVLDLLYRCSLVQGGPVMGAALNNRTPNFDLIGDVVKVSNSLCREAPPGSIVINAAMSEALTPVKFSTQRAVSCPKGKERTITLIGLQ
jgi:class 3 adenylate cyclase